MITHSQLGILALTAALAGITPAGAATPKDDGQKMICKSQAKTGTRFPKKICMTKHDWDLAAERAKKEAAELFDKPQVDLRREPGQ